MGGVDYLSFEQDNDDDDGRTRCEHVKLVVNGLPACLAEEGRGIREDAGEGGVAAQKVIKVKVQSRCLLSSISLASDVVVLIIGVYCSLSIPINPLGLPLSSFVGLQLLLLLLLMMIIALTC